VEEDVRQVIDFWYTLASGLDAKKRGERARLYPVAPPRVEAFPSAGGRRTLVGDNEKTVPGFYLALSHPSSRIFMPSY